jgi:hypothetical protein
MLRRNVDFFGVFFIALAMLGFAGVRSWHLPEALDSIHIENAIQMDRCTNSRQVWSNLASIFH